MDERIIVCRVSILLYCVFLYEVHVSVVGYNLVEHRAMSLLSLYCIASNLDLESNLARIGIYVYCPYTVLFIILGIV